MKASTPTSEHRSFTSALWRTIVGVSVCLLFFFYPLLLSAQYTQQPTYTNLPDDTATIPLTASLLTCAPGDESYELYGHTALRIRGGKNGDDVVYNYGYFNFKRPHFVWHFILGETDYSLRPMSWEHFYMLYTDEGRWIDEQTLNLTPEEADKLLCALEVNRRQAMQEGWTYRYNYLTDNCTTRAIDQICDALDGELVLSEKETTTYRLALHRYTEGHAWSQLGNDMLLGAGCDKSIGAEEQLFLPIEAENLLKTARIKGADGSLRPLIKDTVRLADLPEKTADSHWPPIVYAVFLLVLTVALTCYEKAKRKTLWGYDALLLTLQGLAGCIITFMVFFSLHATVDSNLLISWLNPLPLFFVWPVMRGLRRQTLSRWLWLQIGMLGVFFILAILRVQYFPAETFVLALCLLIRAAWHLRKQFMK